MSIVYLECMFEDLHTFHNQVSWLEENGITIVSTRVMGQASGFPEGWLCKIPVIQFENEEDAMAYKLRWL